MLSIKKDSQEKNSDYLKCNYELLKNSNYFEKNFTKFDNIFKFFYEKKNKL